MPDSLALTLALNLVLNAIPSGLAGYAMARRIGLRVTPSVLAGGLLPWVGLLVPLLTGRGKRRPAASARSGLGVVGFGVLALGVVLLLVSLTAEWASVEGSVHDYGTSLSGRMGDSGFGQVAVVLVTALFLGLGAGAWWRGGLRFALPLAWLATGLMVTMLDAAIGSSMLSGLVDAAVSLAGGHAAAGVWVGLGARFALGGLSAVYLSSLLLLAQGARTTAEPAKFAPHIETGAPVSVLPHSSTPVSSSGDDWGTAHPIAPRVPSADSGWSTPVAGAPQPAPPSSDGW